MAYGAWRVAALALALALAPAQSLPVAAADIVRANSGEMLDASERALAQGDTNLARKILEALQHDPVLQVRNEARFRLAMLSVAEGDWTKAGVLLRAILDEEPGAQRARLELARVLAEAGYTEKARRTLREAQAGGLPPEVARTVERFSAALTDRRPNGGSVQIAFAPDSNINRATQSRTIGTTLGDFVLDREARQQSGIGLAIKGEGFVRQRAGTAATLLATGSFDADLYRHGAFDNILGAVRFGAEFPVAGGKSRVLFSGERQWFGGSLYSDAVGAMVDWARPVGKLNQLSLAVSVLQTDLASSDVQDARSYSTVAKLDHALSAVSGLGAQLGVTRQIAADPGYSLMSEYGALIGWREFGRSTVTVAATFQHLEADKRLQIYPRRRSDDFLRISIAATHRALQIGGWAPEVRIMWEGNASSIEIYRYRRVRAEFGAVRSF